MSALVAAIDCGTNAIRLLVASVDAQGRLDERVREMRIVRLGEGVDVTGEFAPVALDRTMSAVDEYARIIANHHVDAVRFVATSASRDVRNREVFVAGVRDRLGVPPEVITGQEEAALSFAGAVRGLPPHLVVAPTLVVDIGGGSTEFVLGATRPSVAVSVDVGCVRMTERHLHGDPPTRDEVAAAESDILAAVDRAFAAVPVTDVRTFVGVSGTVTTMSAMAMGLPAYDAARLHGSTMSSDDVADVTARLLAMPRHDRAALPFMHPGRVDVIGGGALVLRTIVRRGGFGTVVVSETDILDGIVYSLSAT